MKTSSIFWGVFFITIGSLVLLNNITDIYFAWGTVWKFWPVVLVLIGVSILVKNKTGKAVVAGLAGLILAFTIFATVSAATNSIHNDFNFVFDGKDMDYDTTYFKEDYSDSIKVANLKFEAGAGTFKILSPTEKLIDVKAEGIKDFYYFNINNNDSTSNIDFSMKDAKFRLGDKHYKNSVEVSLNPNPIWDIYYGVGASSVDLDLTPYKVSNLEVDMGAAALNVKLGDLADKTNLSIEAGASDIDILVPEIVGCEIKTDAALSSKNFKGFNKISSDYYKTPGFENAAKKIYINIECGVSSITVTKY